MSALDRIASFEQGPAVAVEPVSISLFIPKASADDAEKAIKALDGIVDGPMDKEYKVIDFKQVVARKTTGTAVGYISAKYNGRIKLVLTGSLMTSLDGFPGTTPA